ncbi:MAG: hypothetical protein Q9166_002154 [cf. Caloplaca sp. 2 TL-2023]
MSLCGLPNPYRIPYSPISLDFAPPGEGLDRVEMVRSFSRFRRTAQKYINSSGDVPIPRGFRLDYTISVLSEMGGPLMTWGLAIKAMRGVNMKMHMEGFKARSCNVQIGTDDVRIGYVKVTPRVPANA